MAAMASLFLLSLLLFSFPSSSSAQYNIFGIEKIYNFGDSLSDTGNLLLQGNLGTFAAIAKLPYGETFFKKATGRCSDGKLMLDYLGNAQLSFNANYLNLPFVNPYLNKDASFTNGVNFAVAGATALTNTYYESQGIIMPYTNTSLGVQFNWFKEHLNTLCSSDTAAACRNRLQKALFMVGEIGGNDYNYAFFQGKTMEQVRSFVPHVVRQIKDIARELINQGAVQLIVPGNFPIGCVPGYLTAFQNVDPTQYDERKCLKGFNEFAQFHNQQLLRALQSLREEFPYVSIKYADFYDAFLQMFDRAAILGFEQASAMKACCGIGGPYNFDATRMCGSEGVPVCSNPAAYIHWDGIHLTQAAYQRLVMQLIYGGLIWETNNPNGVN